MRVTAAALMMLTAAPAFGQTGFSGYWYGTQPHRRDTSYLLTIRPDGTFETRFRSCIDRKAYDRSQAGTWALTDGLVTYHVATVNGVPRPRVDYFRLVSVDAKQQTVTLIPHNLTFVTQRVDKDFQLPSCLLLS